MKLGIDLGGTKIEAAVIDDDGVVIWRERQDTPTNDYQQIIQIFGHLIATASDATGYDGNVGVAIPGSIDPQKGVVAGSSLPPINGKDLAADCEAAINRPFRVANDANCFALSEAVDGAASGFGMVYGVILGTGVGGGIAIDRRVRPGANAIAGEWGHNPLPWPTDDERPGSRCYCGQHGCIETFLSGPAFARQFYDQTRRQLSPSEIAAAADHDHDARAAIAKYVDRLARSLAQVINILDPDAIVLGGGMSNISELYEAIPALWSKYVFSDSVRTKLLAPRHGDASGVRGAAWL
jgi:fructokinase